MFNSIITSLFVITIFFIIYCLYKFIVGLFHKKNKYDHMETEKIGISKKILNWLSNLVLNIF